MEGSLPGEPIRRELAYGDIAYKTTQIFKQTVQEARGRSGGGGGGSMRTIVSAEG